MIIKRDTTNLFVKVSGTGFPLVFIHGNGEEHRVFKKQIEYYKEKHRLILFDTRIHGKSTGKLQKYDFNQLADDVLFVLNKLGITKANFIGFSDGANTLFHIALKNKTIINKAVAISGNLNPKGVKRGVRFWLKLSRAFFVLMSCIKKFRIKNYQYYLMTNNPRLEYKDLDKISNDFLVLAGSNDIVKEEHTKEIHNHIKNSKLVILDGCDHFAMVKNPNDVNRQIDSFLVINNRCSFFGTLAFARLFAIIFN